MVLAGQFLERPTLIPVGDLVLEGVAHRSTRAGAHLLVLPPASQEGGGMDHVVGAELAWAAAREGCGVLRFNYRGVGASQGERGDARTRLDDAAAAWQLARENALGRAPVIAAIGEASSETALALAAANPDSPLVVLLGATGIPAAALKAVRAGVLLVIPDSLERAVGAPLRQRAEASAGVVEIADCDPNWNRNLPEVGKAVVQALRRLPSG